MPESDRYSRQSRFPSIGPDGQSRLSHARVAILGIGALGTVSADLIVRAGAGSVRLIDRDFVELSNLQRQSLFDEEDVRGNLPKSVAAANRLRRINSAIEIEERTADVNSSTVEDLIENVDLVLDGLDNFETRFVVNDACARTGTPWIYAAAVGSYGLTMPILPGKTACLRCIVPSLPAPGSSPTCETAGVIGPISHAIASIQCALALRFLTGQLAPADVRLTSFDVWTGRFLETALPAEVRQTCPVCSEGRLDFLTGDPLRTVTLCGRNAVQLMPAGGSQLDFESLSRAAAVFGPVQFNDFLLRCSYPPYELTVFRDGRAIVKGTEEPGEARSVYTKIVGM